MNKKFAFANASLLTFITISSTNKEHIFFIHVRELDEQAPQDLYWYPNRGKDGKAQYIWKDKAVKQWQVIGKDDQIDFLFSTIINSCQLAYDWGKVSVVFETPKLEIKVKENKMHKIEGICSCIGNAEYFNWLNDTADFDISFLIAEKNNCSFIEGYKFNEKISPLQPLGLLEPDTLYECLKENTHCLKEKRIVQIYSRGDSKIKENEDTKRMYGFVQSDVYFRKKHKIEIYDLDGNELLGESDIDQQSGKWSINLAKATSRGQFRVRNKETTEYYCGHKYYLLKNINVQTHIAHSVLKDLYGREISLSGNMEHKPPLKEPMVWEMTYAPDIKQSEIELSDKVLDVLLTLGKKIIFNDPYFLGDFNAENKQFTVRNKSQSIFLNALITAIAKGGIEEITIIGNWGKVKKIVNSDKEGWYSKYRLLYKVITENFKNTNVNKLKKFEVICSNQPFHDRYWISGGEDKIVYHLSNSISGLFEHGELRIIPADQIDKMGVVLKIANRLKETEKKNLALE